ncbi:YppF family protein [Anoxybacteroides tepidamans]|uniref:YppF family protein n=1 Tax=Anoxybacteroides tepidamans TaxID=265948 RepID=UPI0009FC1455|nr:YppF family protein [Anoxybacillus tepidamans]
MNAAQLRGKFIALKNHEPADMNGLLDFARQMYLRGEISIAEYRDIARELESAGAYQPE